MDQPTFAPDPRFDGPPAAPAFRPDPRFDGPAAPPPPGPSPFKPDPRFDGPLPAAPEDPRLAAARARQAGEGESTLEYFGRRSGPFAAAVGNWAREHRYQSAVEAFHRGEATDRDYEVIARHERLQEIDRDPNATLFGRVGGKTGREVGDALAGLPAVAGEAYLTGGASLAPRAGASLLARGLTFAGSQAIKTPLMPSLYLEQGAKAQTADPGESAGAAYGKALGYGYLNNLVLGQLQARVPAPGGLAGRVAAKTGLGVAEQQAADAIAGATGLHTGYGLAGDFLDPNTPAEDAWRHATVQAVTFAAFSGHHEALEAWGKAGKAMAAAGVPKDAAAKTLSDLQDAVLFAPTPEARQKVVADLPEGSPVRLFGEHLLDGLDKAEERTPPAVASPPTDVAVPPTRAARIGLGEADPAAFTAPARPGSRVTVRQGLAPRPEPPVTVTAPPEAPPATTYGDTPPIAPGSPLPRPGPEPTPGPAEPPIAPLGGRAARDSALEAAQGHVRAGKGPAVYVDMDVDNAKGLDRAVGGPGPAAEHIRAMVGLVREELAAIPGATAEVFRHAGDPMGDEHSAVVTGATKARVNEALARARERIGAHAAAAGLHEVPHAKGEGRPAGVGLSMFAEPLEAGRPWRHTVTEAEAGTESVKARRNQPAPPVTPTAVERMRQSQAKKGGVAPRPGATEAGGELRPPPEALSPKQKLARARNALEQAGAEAMARRWRDEVSRPEQAPAAAAPGRAAPKPPEQVRAEQLASVLANRLAQAHRAVREAVKAGTDATRERVRQAVDAVRRSARAAGEDADARLAGAVPGFKKLARELKLTDRDFAAREKAAERAGNREAAEGVKNAKGMTSLEEVIASKYKLSQDLGATRATGTELGDHADVKRPGNKTGRFEAGVASQVAKEHGIPREVWAKKGERGWDLGELAVQLHRDGHIAEPTAEHLWEQLSGRKPSLKDFEIGGAGGEKLLAAEEARRRAEQEDADEAARHAFDPDEVLAGEGRGRPAAPDTSFDFGHNAEAAAERLLAAQFAKNAGAGLPEAMGAASFGFTPEARQAVAEHLRASAVRFVHGVQDFAGRLGGQIAPTISRFSAAAGNAVARLGSVGHYARLWPSVMLDRVLPAGSGQADRLRVGAAMVEWVLRDIRTASLRESERASDAGVAALRRAQQAQTPKEKAAAKKEAAEAFARANEYREKAGKVASVVGGSLKDPSVQYPLPDEASYHAALADPKVQDAIAKHKSEAAPDLIRAFEKATGIDSDEYDTLRDFNAMPISLVVPREGEASATAFVPGNSSRGRLGNQSLRRLSASYEATGASSKGYELDYGKILERMAADRFPLAAKADAYRVWEKEGVGRWGEPGETNTVDGATWKRMPNVNPPRGSQAAETGQTAFFVDPRFWPEAHQVLGLNEPPGRVPFSSLLSKLTLASTVEAAYHSRNLLTMLTRPGYNPLDTVRHAYRLVLKDPATMRAVLDLAEVGAMKEHGFEAPVFLGKYNPLARFQKATGAFLTVVDRAVRLSAADAFDRVAKRPGVENSERAKRDFINQAGNYSKLTQSRVVAWLRDTGLGPFATAGSNFYVQGLRGLVGAHGVRTTSYKADLKLRAEMLVRMAVLPAVAAAVNYALWGRADGDDKTPLFGLKLGTDAKGKTSYLDLGGLTGITRGMRETGLQALAESQRAGAKRAGATPSDAFDRGVSDAALALLHPAIGPPVAAVHTALTGKNTLGGQVAPRADLKKGESQAERNLWAALWQTNPVLESYVEPYANRAAGFKEQREESLQEKAMKMFGPFGVKTRGEAPGAPHRRVEIPVPASPQQRADQQARRGLAPPRR